MAQFSFPSNRMHNGMSYILKEYSFFYQLIFNDTFVNLTKMWKQRFMKKRMLRKKINPLCTASDFRGKGGCWEALLLKNSIVQVWNTLVWLACSSARKTQRYAKMGSKIFWGRVLSFCAVGFHKKNESSKANLKSLWPHCDKVCT